MNRFMDILELKYELFLDKFKHTIVFEKENFDPFILYHTIFLSIDILSDKWDFLLHFWPETKIWSPISSSVEYFLKLKSAAKKIDDEMKIKIQDLSSRSKFIELKIDAVEWIKRFSTDKSMLFWTFDYHFLKSYNPNLFYEISQVLQKKLFKIDVILEEIKKASNKIISWDLYEIEEKFHKVERIDLSNNKNILVWSFNTKDNTFWEHKIYEKQSGCFYCGVYSPVNNKTIQIINFWINKNSDKFIELFDSFNKWWKNIVFNESISGQDIEIIKQGINNVMSKKSKELFLVFLCDTKLPDKFFGEYLKKIGVQYQTSIWQLNQSMLSNYVVQCIQKMWWTPWLINNLFVEKPSYFFWIDIWHNQQQRTSSIWLVVYNQNWDLVRYISKWWLPLNEALNKNVLCEIFQSIKPYIAKDTKHIIIHRDWKSHKHDVDILVSAIKEIISTKCEIDIVDIIKSWFPIMWSYDETSKTYWVMVAGTYRIFKSFKYGLVITNDQKEDWIPRPLVIRHIYWNIPFDKIIEQVYWFTKVCTYNLYFWTRLPATTKKANNLATTSNRQFIRSHIW